MTDLLKLYSFLLATHRRLVMYSLKQEQNMLFALKVEKRFQIKLQSYFPKSFMKLYLQWIRNTVYAKLTKKQRSKFVFNAQTASLANFYVGSLSLKRHMFAILFKILKQVSLKNLIQNPYLTLYQLKLISSLVVSKKCMTFATDLDSID